MTAQGKVDLDPLLERRQAKLLEAGDLGSGERLVGEVRERRPPPEGEGLPQGGRGRLSPAGDLRFPRLLDQPLEAVEIELARLEP